MCAVIEAKRSLEEDGEDIEVKQDVVEGVATGKVSRCDSCWLVLAFSALIYLQNFSLLQEMEWRVSKVENNSLLAENKLVKAGEGQALIFRLFISVESYAWFPGRGICFVQARSRIHRHVQKQPLPQMSRRAAEDPGLASGHSSQRSSKYLCSVNSPIKFHTPSEVSSQILSLFKNSIRVFYVCKTLLLVRLFVLAKLEAYKKHSSYF